MVSLSGGELCSLSSFRFLLSDVNYQQNISRERHHVISKLYVTLPRVLPRAPSQRTSKIGARPFRV
jgi:hypothetical protein